MTYEWVSGVEAVAVTYVRGLEPRQVGELLRFDWATERRATFTEAEDQQHFDSEQYAVQVEQVESARGSWIILVEPNGYLASLPEAVQALSDADVAVSVYWNVNAQMRFAMYADGVLIRSFDPLVRDLEPEGKPLAEEEGLQFGGEGDPRAGAMELAERLTGCGISPDWLLDVPHPTWTAAGFLAA